MRVSCVAKCWGYIHSCTVWNGYSIPVQVTEAEVAQHFADCGQIMDCRVCGDPNSAMRFAFIEFKEEASVMKVAALHPLFCTRLLALSCKHAHGPTCSLALPQPEVLLQCRLCS